jgi:hypothetical protein
MVDTTLSVSKKKILLSNVYCMHWVRSVKALALKKQGANIHRNPLIRPTKKSQSEKERGREEPHYSTGTTHLLSVFIRAAW